MDFHKFDFPPEAECVLIVILPLLNSYLPNSRFLGCLCRSYSKINLMFLFLFCYAAQSIIYHRVLLGLKYGFNQRYVCFSREEHLIRIWEGQNYVCVCVCLCFPLEHFQEVIYTIIHINIPLHISFE